MKNEENFNFGFKFSEGSLVKLKRLLNKVGGGGFFIVEVEQTIRYSWMCIKGDGIDLGDHNKNLKRLKTKLLDIKKAIDSLSGRNVEILFSEYFELYGFPMIKEDERFLGGFVRHLNLMIDAIEKHKTNGGRPEGGRRYDLACMLSERYIENVGRPKKTEGGVFFEIVEIVFNEVGLAVPSLGKNGMLTKAINDSLENHNQVF